MELDEQLMQKVENYQPDRARLAALSDTPIIFMVGISGAGKDTTIRELQKQYSNEYRLLVSHTTRAPRENNGVMERDGVEYYFIDFTAANQMLDAKDFVEANVYSSNIYGTSVAEIQRAHDEGRVLVGDVDVNGVAHFVELMPTVKPIFILPPDYETWQKRLLTRYKAEVDREDWLRRVRTAQQEIEHVLSKDYYYLVVNKDLGETTKTIHAIAHGEITEKRSPRTEIVAQQILAELRKVIS